MALVSANGVAHPPDSAPASPGIINYTTTKDKRLHPNKMETKKFDLVVRKHIAYYALDLARKDLTRAEDTWTNALRLARSHAPFIEDRLSLHSSSGNHSVAEGAALVHAGLLFPEPRGARCWYETGLRLLEREAPRQVLPDGGPVEQAFWYHLFVLAQEFRLASMLEGNARICITEPLGYIEFMNLVSNARAVITDSGGVQEETTYLGVPCLTLRENTERPITVTEGSNRLVKPAELVAMIESVLAGKWPRGRRPERWDGKAADRCVAALRSRSPGLRTES